MKKPRRITLVPAHSIVQLGTTGTGRTFSLPVYSDKSMRVVDFPDATKYVMHSPGEGKSHWESFARKQTKQAATDSYKKRVNQTVGNKHATTIEDYRRWLTQSR